MLLPIGPSRYALPIDAVREVVRLPAITRVPGLPEFVAGLVNVRGRVLAVLDLRPLLHLDVPRGDRLVLLDGGTATGRSCVGLVVDAALDLVAIPRRGLQPLPPGVPDAAATVLARITVVGDETIAVLSPAGLLGLGTQIGGAKQAA